MGFTRDATYFAEVALLISATLMLHSAWSFAATTDRLWLPAKYQALYPSLVEAAVAAEALQRCVTILEGTLDLEQSKPQHPIFRFVCRQENGRSYTEMVDGLSYATLTTPIVTPPDPTPEQLAQQQQIVEAQRLVDMAQRKIDDWGRCRRELERATELMLELQWLADLSVVAEPVVSATAEIQYAVDFDATDIAGERLHYRAVCTHSGEQVSVKLGKR